MVEKQADKSRNKVKLIEEIKRSEVELKEIREKVDQQDDKVKEEEYLKKQLSRIDGHKKDKEINDMKTELYRLESQLAREDNKLIKLQKDYKTTKREAKFTIHPNYMLGYDRDRNQYWYFYFDPTKLYVQKETDKENTQWFIYKTTKEIVELKES